MPIAFGLNGSQVSWDGDPETPLLWVVRDGFDLTGTKFGCGVAQCGACTVHVDGKARRACITPIDTIAGKQVTTIEGASSRAAQAIKSAWIANNVPQCGYCQSGQVMSATALLAEKPKPTDAEIDAAMTGNLCRCATYVRIRRAIHDAAQAAEAV